MWPYYFLPILYILFLGVRNDTCEMFNVKMCREKT
jgi:hypothetical protein